MSVEAMNWALAQKTGSPSAKSVLLILANRANHEGICWPGIDGIAEQTELSRRSVIAQLRKLEEVGLMSVHHRGGTGVGRQSNVYLLHIGQSANSAHRGNVHDVHGANGVGQCATDAGQCARRAPEPSDKPSKNPKGGARATRIPEDFALTPERRSVAEAEEVPAERTFAKFCDYWRAESGQKARKRDWDATWRNWCRREADGSPGRRKSAEFEDPYFKQMGIRNANH